MALSPVQQVFALIIVILLLVYAQRHWGSFGEVPESFSAPMYYSATTHESWTQQSAQQMNPQDSPWIWLEKRPSSQQVSQNEKAEPPAQFQPVKKEDRVYDSLTPAERMQMMENMRQFRIDRLEENDDEPVCL